MSIKKILLSFALIGTMSVLFAPPSYVSADVGGGFGLSLIAQALNSIQAMLDNIKNVLLGLTKDVSTATSSGNAEEASLVDAVPGEILVKFKDSVGASEQSALLRKWGFSVKEEIPKIKVKVIRVPEAAEEQVVAALAKNPRIDFAELNRTAKGSIVPNDPGYGNQWHWSNIAAPAGWDISTGAPGTIIAVVDSGIDPTHPDLASKLVPGRNYLTSDTSDTHDVLGHGTATGGTAGAISNNGVGVAGAAWENRLMPLVVLNSSNSASYSNMANAIIYAADQGVRVISMSLGGTSFSSTLQNAVTYAWGKGSMLFASAMNNNTNTPAYPAAMDHAIAVAATNSSNTKAGFSNYGSWIDVSAPGEYIYTTTNGGGYGAWNGTSFSSPIVAGLAGLLFSHNPSLTNSQVESLIKNNADDLGTPGFDDYYGWGKVNFERTLAAAGSPPPPPPPDTTAPAVSISSPSDGATVSGSISVNITATDNTGVTKVELWRDGVLFGTDTSAPYSFFWDTNNSPNGSHVLVARAYDAANNVGISASVTVTVSNTPDATPPTVIITSPANGSAIPTRGNLSVSVSASDNIGVASIEIYFDDVLNTTCTNSTSCTGRVNTKKVSKGTHTVKARAYDAAGNMGEATVTVTK